MDISNLWIRDCHRKILIKINSASYISAELSYFPNWFEVSNYQVVKRNSMISLVPTWGFRQNFANNFNYELKLGLGVNKELISNSNIRVMPIFSLKLGYDF